MDKTSRIRRRRNHQGLVHTEGFQPSNLATRWVKNGEDTKLYWYNQRWKVVESERCTACSQFIFFFVFLSMFWFLCNFQLLKMSHFLVPKKLQDRNLCLLWAAIPQSSSAIRWSWPQERPLAPGSWTSASAMRRWSGKLYPWWDLLKMKGETESWE